MIEQENNLDLSKTIAQIIAQNLPDYRLNIMIIKSSLKIFPQFRKTSSAEIENVLTNLGYQENKYSIHPKSDMRSWRLPEEADVG